MNWKLFGFALLAVPAATVPAFAHHSFSMFDAEKTVALSGTVKEFEWTNPHAWLRIMVNDATSGKAVQYAVEMGSPGQQARVGWKPDSVKPGDVVTVRIHPLKDGSRGGQFVSATLPGGQQLGMGGQKNNAEGE